MDFSYTFLKWYLDFVQIASVSIYNQFSNFVLNNEDYWYDENINLFLRYQFYSIEMTPYTVWYIFHCIMSTITKTNTQSTALEI